MSASSNEKRASRSFAAKLLKSVNPQLSYRTLRTTKQVEIVMTVDETWGPVAFEVIQFMGQMVGFVNRFAEAGFRDMRSEEMLAELEVKYDLVRQRYQALRSEGIKHRMAVHSLVTDRNLPFYGRWRFPEYNWCVKSLSSNRSIRPLRKV